MPGSHRHIVILRCENLAGIGKYRYADTLHHMPETETHDLLDVLKALSNPKRLQIMGWLRDPEAHFAPQADPMDEVGVCVKQIQEKAGVSQSTASQFMSVLQRAGLVQSTRIGPWTYYRRNELRIAALPDLLEGAL
jgi:DNA-binding transcriptional ArsR family regulator